MVLAMAMEQAEATGRGLLMLPQRLMLGMAPTDTLVSPVATLAMAMLPLLPMALAMAMVLVHTVDMVPMGPTGNADTSQPTDNQQRMVFIHFILRTINEPLINSFSYQT